MAGGDWWVDGGSLGSGLGRTYVLLLRTDTCGLHGSSMYGVCRMVGVDNRIRVVYSMK